MKKPWWHPSSLAEAERKARGRNTNLRSDFGSYFSVLNGKGLEESLADQHNDLNPKNRVKWIIKALGLSGRYSVLDAGCGLGFTTTALAQELKGSTVLGIDVSHDGIEYAKKRFANAAFACAAINPEEPATLSFFDLIFCFEFYPFTRNAEADFQANFIRYLAGQLKHCGMVVIYQKWDNPQSLSAVLTEVRSFCPELEFKLQLLPNPKIPPWLTLRIGLIVSRLLGIALNRNLVRTLLVISRKEEPI